MQEIRHEQTLSHGEMEEPVQGIGWPGPCPSAPHFPVFTAPHLPLFQGISVYFCPQPLDTHWQGNLWSLLSAWATAADFFLSP